MTKNEKDKVTVALPLWAMSYGFEMKDSEIARDIGVPVTAVRRGLRIAEVYLRKTETEFPDAQLYRLLVLEKYLDADSLKMVLRREGVSLRRFNAALSKT